MILKSLKIQVSTSELHTCNIQHVFLYEDYSSTRVIKTKIFRIFSGLYHFDAEYLVEDEARA